MKRGDWDENKLIVVERLPLDVHMMNNMWYNFKNYINKVINIYYEENPEFKRASEENELKEIYKDYADRVKESLDEIEIKTLIGKLKSFSRKYQLTEEILEELRKIEDDCRGVRKNYFIDKSYFQKRCWLIMEDTLLKRA